MDYSFLQTIANYLQRNNNEIPFNKQSDYQDILLKNKHLNFVDRLYNAEKYPRINNPDGTYSTHKMMSMNVDGMPIVFPTIVYNPTNNELQELSPNDAVKYALKHNEYIRFTSDLEANDFANNGYKRGFNF